MAPESVDNRSSALSKEQLATMTSMMNEGIKTALESAMAQFAPIIQQLAVTPEKLREANRPWVDPKVEERNRREMKLWKEDQEEILKNARALKDQCLHIDERGQSSINLMRNFPDRQPRGICLHCLDLINPREWRIGPPTSEFPRGKPYVAPAHKDYGIVMQLMRKA